MAEINPTSLATQLATAYTQSAQSLLTQQSKNAQTTSTALTKLQSALQAFDSALTGLSANKSPLQFSSTLNTTGFATATASSTAMAGTYSLFVEQVATAHQVAFNDLPAIPVSSSGTLTVSVANGSSFNVDLNSADTDGDGTLSQTEIARAINQAPNNQGLVNAMLVTVNGQTQLVMSAGSTGASSLITLDTSGLAASALKTSLDNPTQLSAAQDAVIWLGDQGTGVKVQQASNTFNAIQGVSLTISKAMQAGDTPLTLTVARDDSGTASNIQKFIDAYNTLENILDDLTRTGDSAKGKTPGAFATDAGVRALRGKLNSLLRQEVGGVSLMNYGVSMNRQGQLSLDQTKMSKALGTNPDGLTTLFGSTSTSSSSGVLGSLDKYMKVWLDSTSGHIQSRKSNISKIEDSISLRQTRLETQYSKAFDRYLAQFSQLQTLQSRMSETSSMFTNLFTSS